MAVQQQTHTHPWDPYEQWAAVHLVAPPAEHGRMVNSNIMTETCSASPSTYDVHLAKRGGRNGRGRDAGKDLAGWLTPSSLHARQCLRLQHVRYHASHHDQSESSRANHNRHCTVHVMPMTPVLRYEHGRVGMAGAALAQQRFHLSPIPRHMCVESLPDAITLTYAA